MKLVVNGRHLEITEHIHSFVTNKMRKLERHMPTLTEVHTELSESPTRAAADRYTCQVTAWLENRTLYAQEQASDMLAAIQATIAKLERQMQKVKVQRQHKGRVSLSASSDRIVRKLALESQ